ncbi:N-acetyltransferase family protein [Deinococcus sp.]|uniref:GNAT family N-acetyltransferase n=1 Tax=Deinococcus sp. TaxID=47478 RepID=UPI003CC5D575
MQIRPVKAQELDALTALARETYRAAYAHDMPQPALDWHLETYLSRSRTEEMMWRDVVLVAANGVQLAGFVQFGAAEHADSGLAEVEIRRLYLLSAFQNQGTGARLMAAALAHPQLQGARRVLVGVWHTNMAAQRFYARFGFVQVGEKPYWTQAGDTAGADLLLVRVQMKD